MADIVNGDTMKKSHGIQQATMVQQATMAIIFTLMSSLCVTHLSAEEIGVAWIGKALMPERISKGMEERLAEIGPEFKLEYKRALPDEDALSAVIKKFETNKDGLVVLRSSGAQYLASHKTSLPTFIGGTNDPVQLGAVQNPLAPEGNITGVTYALPIAGQFETFKALLPTMKKIVLLVEKGHPSGIIENKKTQEAARKLSIELITYEIDSLEDLIRYVSAHAGSVDAFIAGTQAKVIDNMTVMIAHSRMTPVLAFSSKPVKDGALGGFVADDHKLGRMLADSMVDVLKNGKSISDVPVKQDPKPVFYVNTKTAKRLGIEIPFHVLALSRLVEY
jgi:putative ABC transport system substrate-binding protein